MEIRSATDSDVPAIVVLLKQSLGEGLMPKSEEFWRWKHQMNPFGRSPVLIATEGKRIVGVRAFLRWEWIRSGKAYRAVRAVDTATDPEFQGKGIFSRLTMSLVEQCKKEGIDFVFNTPNQQSKPGYLKMGWRDTGKLPVKFSVRLFNTVGNLSGESSDLKHVFEEPATTGLIQQKLAGTESMQTNYSVPYLVWRYQQNPTIQYRALSDWKSDEGYLLIYRIKATRFGNEFRVVDFLKTKGYDRRRFKKKLNSALSESQARWLTRSPGDELPNFGISLPVGPVCTIRDLNLEHADKFVGGWMPSLGTMEVF